MRTALLSLALLLAGASTANAEALSVDITKQGTRCTSTAKLRSASGSSCQTKLIGVKFRGGAIPVRLRVLSLAGCPTAGIIVRTTGKRTGNVIDGSFTEVAAAAGAGLTKNLTQNLGRSAPDYAPGPRSDTLTIEAPWRACGNLSRFKVRVTFPTISAPRS